MECPICLSISKVDSTMMMKIKEQEEEEKEIEKVLCSLCDDEATEECEECKAAVCSKEDCRRKIQSLHEKARKYKHELHLTSITKSIEIEIGRCEEHGKELEMFCEEDSVPVCSACLKGFFFFLKYQNLTIFPNFDSGVHGVGGVIHKNKKIEEAAMELMEVLKIDEKELESKMKEIEKSVIEHEHAKQQVKGHHSTGVFAIDVMLEEIKTQLEIRRKKLIEKCEMIAQSKEKSIEENERKLKSHQLMTEIEIESIRRIFGEGTPTKICLIGPHLHDRIKSFNRFQVNHFLFSVFFSFNSQIRNNTAKRRNSS